MILVSGATGYIGGHLVEALLARGHEVRCLVRPSSESAWLEQTGVDVVRGNLLDVDDLRRAVAGVDTVFHLAAVLAESRRGELMRVNAAGTRAVALACAERETPPVLLYLSSVAAAGPTVSGRLRREVDPAAPVSEYGRSKRAGELAVAALADRVPATIVRPGVVFGGRNRDLLPVCQAIRWTRVHLVPSLLPPPLSLIDVRDLVELMIRAAERGRRIGETAADAAAARNGGQFAEGTYFACLDQYPDYGQFGRLIAEVLGYAHIIVMPCIAPVSWAFGGCGQVASLVTRRASMLNLDKMREALAESWACSNEAARRDLQFEPAHSPTDGLQTTVSWYRELGWLP